MQRYTYFVKKNPERGGVTKLPNPQPIKNMEDNLPVIFFFLATQEKQDPNCHEMKNPSTAVPIYKDVALDPPMTHRKMAAPIQRVRDIRIMFLGATKAAISADTRRPHMKPPL